MEILKVTITKKAFLSLSEDEQVFLVQATRLHDDLAQLGKILLFLGKAPRPDLDLAANVFQKLFIILNVIGHLCESWKVLANQFTKSSCLNAKYYAKLSNKSKEKYDAIKREFGQGSWIIAARNRLIYHRTDRKSILEAIATLQDAEELDYYVSNGANSLFAGTHHLTLRSLITVYVEHHHCPTIVETLDNSEHFEQVTGEMFDDIVRLERAFTYFFQDVICLILKDSDSREGVTKETLDIPEPPKISEIRIPYFVSKG